MKWMNKGIVEECLGGLCEAEEKEHIDNGLMPYLLKINRCNGIKTYMSCVGHPGEEENEDGWLILKMSKTAARRLLVDLIELRDGDHIKGMDVFYHGNPQWKWDSNYNPAIKLHFSHENWKKSMKAIVKVCQKLGYKAGDELNAAKG